MHREGNWYIASALLSAVKTELKSYTKMAAKQPTPIPNQMSFRFDGVWCAEYD